MATKIIELDEYGFEGETLSLREPTAADLIAVNDYSIREKKRNGEVNGVKASLYLFSRLIEDAPFGTKPDGLSTINGKLLMRLATEVKDMMSPLPTSEEASW